MLSPNRPDRSLPTFITLLVVGVLLMTLHVRLEGGGVVGVLRTGTQALLAPLQKGTAFVVTPVADALDSLSNVASLRERNAVLEAELAEAEAELIAVQDQIARLELFEALYRLDEGGTALGRTVANVIGAVDVALIIDKGSSDGVVAGQPVIDTNGYVVGTVTSVGPGSAVIAPITAERQGISVLVGAQPGLLVSRALSGEMTLEMDLEVYDAREPVLAGDRVVTSAVSIDYPAGLPVGDVLEDASPVTGTLRASVRVFVEPETLRLVVVLAWPPDPITAATDDTLPEEATTTTTTTTAPEQSTTTGGEG